MKEIQIKQPHGYLFDNNGDICLKFGNWKVGTHTVPDYVDLRRDPEYVNGPAAHDKPITSEYR